jgi:hypothetical protein
MLSDLPADAGTAQNPFTIQESLTVNDILSIHRLPAPVYGTNLPGSNTSGYCSPIDRRNLWSSFLPTRSTQRNSFIGVKVPVFIDDDIHQEAPDLHMFLKVNVFNCIKECIRQYNSEFTSVRGHPQSQLSNTPDYLIRRNGEVTSVVEIKGIFLR